MNVTFILSLLLAGGVGILLGWMRASLQERRELNQQRELNIPLQAELEQKRTEITRLSDLEARLTRENDSYMAQLATLNAASSALSTKLEHAEQLAEERRLLGEQLRRELDGEKLAKAKLESDMSALRVELTNERNMAAEKLVLLNEAKMVLSNQFEKLAADILDKNSRKFTEVNQFSLTQLLGPFEKQLTEFRSRVEETHKDSLTTNTALKTKIEALEKLNQNLSEQATNLTNALRGSVKSQGDWGEHILEEILVSSGLRRDYEFRVQETMSDEENRRSRPDVILNLPGGRHLVIDSKVSLNSYVDYANAKDEAAKNLALKQLLQSVQEHVKELSTKKYQNLYQLQTLDFVILFVPIEQAFLLALSKDDRLWHDAYDRNVLLVSPTTLLFVVRTVANLWRQEQQTRNVQRIVVSAQNLYDKFTDFVKDLQDLGSRLDQAQRSYDSAFRKLSKGEKGTLIGRVEHLRKLGIKPSKRLPLDLIPEEELPEDAGDEEEETPALPVATPSAAEQEEPLVLAAQAARK